MEVTLKCMVAMYACALLAVSARAQNAKGIRGSRLYDVHHLRAMV